MALPEINKNLKYGIIFLLSVAALFLVLKFFNLLPHQRVNACPAPKCQEIKLNSQGQAANGQDDKLREFGLVHQDFPGSLPTGFPKDMPIDPKPIQVFQSYVETRPADTDPTVEQPATRQIFYSYTTLQDPAKAAANFEQYLKSKNYTTILDKQTSTSRIVYTIVGNKILGTSKQIVSVTVSPQNKLAQLVSISFIIPILGVNTNP